MDIPSCSTIVEASVHPPFQCSGHARFKIKSHVLCPHLAPCPVKCATIFGGVGFDFPGKRKCTTGTQNLYAHKGKHEHASSGCLSFHLPMLSKRKRTTWGFARSIQMTLPSGSWLCPHWPTYHCHTLNVLSTLKNGVLVDELPIVEHFHAIRSRHFSPLLS